MKKTGKKEKIDEFRRKLVRTTIYSAPILTLFFDGLSSRAQAQTVPPPGDLPAPRIQEIIRKRLERRKKRKKMRESTRRRIRRLRPLEDDLFSIRHLDEE